jgi:hypothetical protein
LLKPSAVKVYKDHGISGAKGPISAQHLNRLARNGADAMTQVDGQDAP